MPQICNIFGCKSLSGKGNGISFFGFPKNEIMRKRWLKAIITKSITTIQTAKVCSKHFVESDFVFGTNRRKLKIAAVPSINCHKQKIPEYTEMQLNTSVSDTQTDVTESFPTKKKKKGPKTPSSLIRQSQAQSNYKRVTTVNSVDHGSPMVIISPEAAIFLSSSLFSDSISDRAIVEDSRFLHSIRKQIQNNEIKTVDVILADKGFNMMKLLG